MKQKGGVLKWTREVIDNNFDSDEEEKVMDIVSEVETIDNIMMPFQWGDTVEVSFSNGKKEKGIINYKLDHVFEILFSHSWVSLVKDKNLFITNVFQDFSGMEINTDVIEIQLLKETSHLNPVTALQITSHNTLLLRKLKYHSQQEEPVSSSDEEVITIEEERPLPQQPLTSQQKIIPPETSDLRNEQVIVTAEPSDGIIQYDQINELHFEHGISISLYGIVEIINLSTLQVDVDRVQLLRTTTHSSQYDYTNEESFQEIFETLQKHPIVNDLETMTRTCHNLNSLYQGLDTISPYEYRWEEILESNQWGFAYFLPVMDFFIPVPPKQVLVRGVYTDDPNVYAFDDNTYYKNKPVNYNSYFYRETANPINYEEFVSNLEKLHEFETNNGLGLHNQGLTVEVKNSIHMANHLMLQEELKEPHMNINLFRTSSTHECKMRGLLSVPATSSFQQSDFQINTKNIPFDLIQRGVTSIIHFKLSLSTSDDEPVLTFSRIQENQVIGKFHVLIKELENHHPLNVNRLVELTNHPTNVMVCLPEHRHKFPANIVSLVNNELVLQAKTRSNKEEMIHVQENQNGDFTFTQENQEPVTLASAFVDVNMLCDFEYEKHFIYYEFEESLYDSFEHKLLANDVMNYLLNLHGVSSLHRYLDEIINLSVTNYEQFNKLFEKYNVNVLQLSFQDVNLFNTIILDKIKDLSEETHKQLSHFKKLLKENKRLSRHVIKKYNDFHVTFPIQTHLQHLTEFQLALHEWKKSISHNESFISKAQYAQYVEEVKQTPTLNQVTKVSKVVIPKDQTYVGVSPRELITVEKVKTHLTESIALQQKLHDFQKYEETTAVIDFQQGQYAQEMSTLLENHSSQLRENIKVEQRVNEYKGSLFMELPKQKRSKASMLWEKYSATLQHTKIAKLMKSTYFRKATEKEDSNWYYDLEGNQVICKHWDSLIEIRLSNSGNYDDLIAEYGRRESGTGFYSCMICGEKLTQIAYSSDEFSKDHTLKSGYTMLEKTSSENTKTIEEIYEDMTKPLERNIIHFIEVFFGLVDVKVDGSEDDYFSESDKVAMMDKIIFFIQSRPYLKEIEMLKNSPNVLELLSEKYSNVYEFLFINQMYQAELAKPTNKNANDERKKQILSRVANIEYVNLISILSMGYLLYKLQTTKSIHISLKFETKVMIQDKELVFNLFGFPSWKNNNVDGLKFMLALIMQMVEPLIRGLENSIYQVLDLTTRFGGEKRTVKDSDGKEKKKMRPFPTSEKDMLSRYYHSVNYMVNVEGSEEEQTFQNSISIPLNDNKDWSERISTLSKEPLHHKILFDSRREYLNMCDIALISNFHYWTASQLKKKEKEVLESNHKMLFYDTVQILQLRYPYQIYPSLKNNDDPFVTLLPIYYCYKAPYVGFPRIFAKGEHTCYVSGEESKAYDDLIPKKEKVGLWQKENPEWTKSHARKLLQQIEAHQIVKFEKEKKSLIPLDDQNKNEFAMFFYKLLELDLFPEAKREMFTKLYRDVNKEDVEIDEIDWRNERIFMEFKYADWGQRNGEYKSLFDRLEFHLTSVPSQGMFSRVNKILSMLKMFVRSAIPCDEEIEVARPMYANQRKWRIEEMHMTLFIEEVMKKHHQIRELFQMIGEQQPAIKSLQTVYSKMDELQQIIRSVTIEMVSQNRELFKIIELFVMNNIYYLFLSQEYQLNSNVVSAVMRYFIPALIEEESVYRHYGDYQYIREAKEKADEREKEFFKAQFQNVPAELRQMEDQLKNLRLGTYSTATRGQNEQVNLF